MSGCLEVAAGSPAVLNYGLGAVALRYQRLGFAVLGLGVGSKRPHKLVRGGVHWASRYPEAVEAVWGRERMAGIGIATGQPSGLLVVDLDRHGEHDGRMVWQQFLEANRLEIIHGPWVQTPSGGEHRYYRLPTGVTVPSRVGILPGVDVRGQDGYVAAPPSRVEVSYDDPRKPGSVLLPYIWHGCPCSLPMAPLWLLTTIINAPGTGGNGNGDGPGEDLPELDELYKHGLPVGLRNETLHRLACQQYRRYSPADPHGLARETIDRVLDATDKRGFTQAEAERAIASARAFVARTDAEDLAAITPSLPWLRAYGTPP